MDAAHSEKRLAWLEEQRLKDTERNAKLGERLTHLEQTLTKQTEQIEEMGRSLARLAALGARIARLDETLAQHRQEVARLLKEAEERRTEKERHAQQLYRADQKDFAKGLAEVRKEIDRLADLREFVQARREEEVRLARNLDIVQKRTDEQQNQDRERAGQLTALREEVGRDHQRLAALQQGSLALQASLEGLRGVVDGLDDRIRRVETRLGELSASEAERNQLQQLWVEQQGRKMVDLEKEVREREKVLASFDSRTAGVAEAVRAFEETHRSGKALQAQLQETVGRMDRRVAEIGEMQRLAEERSKQAWLAFQAEEQKRWDLHKVTAEEQWREHSRSHDRMVREFSEVRQAAQQADEMVRELSDRNQRRLAEILDSLRQWLAEMDGAAASQP